MSNSASQAENTPAWKQEVNRRLDAHKRRIGSSAEPEVALEDQHNAGGRGAEVAARVAARYAHAPSYSEILAGEARAAVRAAEVASRAALDAQAAAESVLAGLEAASEAEAAPVRSAHRQRIYEIAVPDGRESGQRAQIEQADFEGVEVAQSAPPMHANLIEFPVELDTERNLRPRRDLRPQASVVEPERQLSIFEVDPGSILNQSVPSAIETEAVATALTGSEWLGIELEEEPVLQEIAPRAISPAPSLYPASIGLRLMAAVVDGALVVAAVLAFAMVAAVKARILPTLRELEVSAAVAMAAIGLLYHVLFFTLAQGTPGMKYAGISLCTFDDQFPTSAQKLWRLGALLLSLLPVGLGVGWALFDEEHLGWHDRLSQTYLRKG